jgi:hypothetical protein
MIAPAVNRRLKGTPAAPSYPSNLDFSRMSLAARFLPKGRTAVVSAASRRNPKDSGGLASGFELSFPRRDGPGDSGELAG